MASKQEVFQYSQEVASRVREYRPICEREKKNEYATDLIGKLNTLGLKEEKRGKRCGEIIDPSTGFGIKISLNFYLSEDGFNHKIYNISSIDLKKKETPWVIIEEGNGVNTYNFALGIEDSESNREKLTKSVDVLTKELMTRDEYKKKNKNNEWFVFELPEWYRKQLADKK